jgi:hypothetical protein
VELDDVTTAIAAGELDGQLEPLVAAVVARVRAGAVDIRWRMRYEGDEWTQDSVTLAELKFAEQHCWTFEQGVGRRRATRVEINPRVTAEHALALLIAHLTEAQGMPLHEATKRAGAVTAAELDGIVDEYEVVKPPKDGSAASTTS